MTITSRSNPRIKQIVKLQERKYREQDGLFLVEGTKPVKECMESGQDIREIFATEKNASFFPGCTEVSEDVFKAISTEMTPQGVLAVVNIPETTIGAPHEPCILLDGLQDPGNVGTIIRTANAAGYRQIYLADCADVYAPKTVRASMSGIFYVQVFPGPRGEILDALKDIPLISADMAGCSVFDFRPPSIYCLCIGNEGNGLSPEVKKRSSYTITIPMEKSCESLNAAVSAGICMYILKNNRTR